LDRRRSRTGVESDLPPLPHDDGLAVENIAHISYLGPGLDRRRSTGDRGSVGARGRREGNIS